MTQSHQNFFCTEHITSAQIIHHSTTEIARIKQLLINNNFPNYLVDQVTKEFINKKQDSKLHAQNKRGYIINRGEIIINRGENLKILN